MTQEDIIYTAGLFDGEGTVGIRKDTRPNYISYTLRCSVTSTNKDIIIWLYNKYGGNYYLRPRTNSKWKDTWVWQLSTRQAKSFLELVIPYLKIKYKQAELGLQFIPLPRKDKDKSIMHAQMKILNARGR